MHILIARLLLIATVILTPPPEEPWRDPQTRLNTFPISPSAFSPDAHAAPQAISVPQNPRLGLNFSNYYKSGGGRAYPEARSAGASYDRVTFDWFRLEPSNVNGGFDLSVLQAYDVLLSDAAAENIEVMGILIGAPDWAADGVYTGSVYRLPANLHLPWNAANNFWGRFVYQIVSRYKSKVRAWEVWNEPNLTQFWSAPPSLYAQLVQVAYQAIKAADPTATVVLGGIYRGVNEQTIRDIFVALRDLPDATANSSYHDVIGFHLYDGGHCSTFDEIGYLRDNYWQPNVGAKPIWITESGVRVSNAPSAGFATPDESASWVIQNYVYALYHNVQRYYYFRTIDPQPNDPEPWGLLDIDGAPRPSYRAYQVAAEYLPSSFEWSVRRWTNENKVSRISFYNTPLGRVTAVWNIGAIAQTFVFTAILPSATLVMTDGATSTLAANAQGQYLVDLPPAPNFRWNHPEGICQVASPPMILVERDVTPPTSILNALPAVAPTPAINLIWSGNDDAAGVWFYDIDYRVGDGPWQPVEYWFEGTSRSFSGLIGQSYSFRVRARDRAGNLQDWSTANVVTTTIDPNYPLPFKVFAPLARKEY